MAATWLLLAASAVAQPVADPRPLEFRDRQEQVRFHALAEQLRCVQCQNQSLADSNAQIAHDLRREVLALMQQGRSDEQIKAFLVERYGQFVLYQPSLEGGGLLLWLAPGALLLGASAGLVLYLRRREARLPPPADSHEHSAERDW